VGRLGARRTAAVVGIVALLLTLALPRSAAAFSAFANMTADSTYDVELTFDVDVAGGAPDRLEILLDFMGATSTFVAPVAASGGHAQYRWDASRDHLTPNTRVTYRWRATVGEQQIVSPAATYLYDDDRSGLNWQTAHIGQATVHWYGGAERQARRFGELTADGAARAEATLGHDLAGPIDIFVYDTQDQFFGALGPGAREWTGAAAYPEIRTVFMWLGGGPQDYLETAIVHEVTHVVFFDATDNPFHEPARWVNEGFAVWSEQQKADDERSLVEFDARDGLFAFPAITQQFPIGDRGARLAYAQGAVLMDMLIADHGRESIARMTAAYRDGATDDEALAAASGTSAEELYAAFFEAFGVSEPQPVSPAPIGDSDVSVPGSSARPAPSGADGAPGGTDGGTDVVPILLVAAGAFIVLGGMIWLMRRSVTRGGAR
jgi:peptidase MA superfamily protein